MKPPKGWPEKALPRRMTGEWAAFYVGVSYNTFIARVEKGVFPKADREGRYDLVLLDAAIDRLNGVAPASQETGKADFSVRKRDGNGEAARR